MTTETWKQKESKNTEKGNKTEEKKKKRTTHEREANNRREETREDSDTQMGQKMIRCRQEQNTSRVNI